MRAWAIVPSDKGREKALFRAGAGAGASPVRLALRLRFVHSLSYWPKSFLSLMIRTFSALRFSALSVKLKDPVITVSWSTSMTLLCMIA